MIEVYNIGDEVGPLQEGWVRVQSDRQGDAIHIQLLDGGTLGTRQDVLEEGKIFAYVNPDTGETRGLSIKDASEVVSGSLADQNHFLRTLLPEEVLVEIEGFRLSHKSAIGYAAVSGASEQ